MTAKNVKSRKVIASVQHAIDIINLFNGSRSELGNAEIAKLLNMDTGTAAGLIHTLKLNNYLDQNSVNRKYRLGLKLAERAAVLLDQLDLRKIAAPYLENLRTWCGESVNLAILDGQEVVYIERLFGSHSLGIRSELGKRAHLHSTALGKSIFAFLKTEEQQALLSNYQFIPVTPFTITDPQRFQSEIEHIKTLGYAIDEQENELGGRCLAAPVFGYDGNPIASISISVPIQRLPPEKISEFGRQLKKAAEDISRDIGYQQN